MTVKDCIENSKEIASKRLTTLWICPEIVSITKIGKSYSCECGLGTKLDEALLRCKVIKHWIENNVLCIVYKPESEPFEFTTS